MNARDTMTARWLKPGDGLAKGVWFTVGININRLPVVNNNKLAGITLPGYSEGTGWIKYA